jgi:hypothetical protein
MVSPLAPLQIESRPELEWSGSRFYDFRERAQHSKEVFT